MAGSYGLFMLMGLLSFSFFCICILVVVYIMALIVLFMVEVSE